MKDKQIERPIENIVNLSGGKDSTAMLLLMLEHNITIDDILFLDTGVEFPEIYSHLDKLEEYTGRKITRLGSDKDFTYYMTEYVKKKGKNKGRCGYGWPRSRSRWCTSLLKQERASSYLSGRNVVQFIGIAADEAHRVKKGRFRYPLIEYGFTEAKALKYCYDHGFTWGGLYEKMDRVSCYLCPLADLRAKKVVFDEYPDLWAHMKFLDDASMQYGWKFRKDYSLRQLEERFKLEDEFIAAGKSIRKREFFEELRHRFAVLGYGE